MRLAQLLARYVTLGLAGLFGRFGLDVGEKGVDLLTEGLVLVFLALGGVFADHLLHRKREAAMMPKTYKRGPK